MTGYTYRSAKSPASNWLLESFKEEVNKHNDNTLVVICADRVNLTRIISDNVLISPAVSPYILHRLSSRIVLTLQGNEMSMRKQIRQSDSQFCMAMLLNWTILVKATAYRRWPIYMCKSTYKIDPKEERRYVHTQNRLKLILARLPQFGHGLE
jgi:hypothetical protein